MFMKMYVNFVKWKRVVGVPFGGSSLYCTIILFKCKYPKYMDIDNRYRSIIKYGDFVPLKDL